MEGFLAGSGSVLLHDLGTWSACWTAGSPASGPSGGSWTWCPCCAARSAAFEPAERRQLGVLLAGGATAASDHVGDDLDLERVRAGLHTVRLLLGLPVHDSGSGDG